MGTDVYITSYDKNAAKTTVLSSAGAASAPVLYAVWSRTSKTVLSLAETTGEADTNLRAAIIQGVDPRSLCIISVPR